MAKKTLTPNKAAYEALCKTNKDNMSLTLVITQNAEWHIVDKPHGMDPNMFLELEPNFQQVFAGWEHFLQQTSRQSMETTHKVAWPDIKIGKALATDEALSVLIWNYRVSKAIDKRKCAQADGKPAAVKNTLQRKSAIAGRTYAVIEPPADAKKFTSPAGLACLAVIKQCCKDNGGTCTEGQLKPMIMAAAATITPKTDSAWRFLQFYRPLLVESQLITYTK